MEGNKYCEGCKKRFQNGEVVAHNSNGGYYHHIVRDLIFMPINGDCAISFSISSEKVNIWRNYIYYEGEFYDFSELDKLPEEDKRTLGIGPNEHENGDLIQGNLEKLSSEH